MLRSVADTQQALQAASADREQLRLGAYREGLAALAGTLQADARTAADVLTARQQEICSTLERTAQTITAQAETHARATIGEIERLVQAPRRHRAPPRR